MSPTIARMHAEHQDITYLLNVLSHQIGAFRAGRTPDLLLMRDIVAQLNEFAADGRDGSERTAIEGIAREDTAAAAQCVALTTEHAEIHRLGTAVLAVLDDIAQGLLMPRSALVSPGRRYIRMFRGHLHREREYLRHYGRASSPEAIHAPGQVGRLGGLRERISNARRNAHLVSRGERVCGACDIGTG